MAGVTDLPFRRLCRRLGAGYVVGEMVSSDPRLRASRKSSLRVSHAGEAPPIAVQIAGSDPAWMADAARYNVALGAQIIDINMGCPAKKVCNRMAGSALLEDPALVREILAAVVAAVDVPVTLKIRTGPDPARRNGPHIAQIAEQCGIAALAVHGRTRADRFKGHAEYQTVREICRAVALPVFANGDIREPEDAARVLDYTGAEGLMIGRAAQGNPWIFREISAYLDDGRRLDPPSPLEVHRVMAEHLRQLHAFYGEHQGVRVARKHIGWYLSGRPGGEALRRMLVRTERAATQLDLVAEYFESPSPLAA
ncbi:MAG: tRNA dihydrouridine synthase DusB [Xanthomonadales bacterium]|nr:tRNA dihydrouridine synthase DusB [Xanthomonadales bacterium]NIN59857.1 tRNA dihydrouridine synthase DusB [Xanthomonadales bacterium]NIN75231.1 tRNA dihydrouridine synthase DusB [Xanthomonadales bacterium]NIO13473.1 tRNA dihydrouridine synthase DusB [Xanthomonadales bacterium]NIP12250.1 tRNA dihydrouridine synthase DusB [Xanthomonadales bacterium]